jgi:enoyl-CoA hydratase/carnithine racemase
MTPTLNWDDKIAVVDFGEDENRFSPEFLDAINAQLDELETVGAQGLVTTARGKFYTNGLDLDWLAAHADQMQSYVARVQAMLARVLTLPMPTAAAVTGHAFGAGAMLAMPHDVRVMRADRGFFCFPEVDIRIPFTDGMAALIQAKLTPHAAVASMTTGRRFGGVEAAAAESAVTAAATDLLRPLAGKDPGTLGAIKRTMFRTAAQALTNGAE